MKKITKGILILIIVCILLGLLNIINNNTIKITKYNISDEKIPGDFNGFKIVQISDYHGKELLIHNNSSIEKKVKALEPDIIVLTGDMIDKDQKDLTPSLDLLELLAPITQTYYVDGNHEKVNYENYLQLQSKIKELGIVFLSDAIVEVHQGSSVINIAGILTQGNTARAVGSNKDYQFINRVNALNDYTILLTHIPELDYSELEVGLILAGHSHGGQVRLPFIGGVYTNGQGFLPEYDKGLFELSSGAKMIINSGIGDPKRIQVPRIANSPEIVEITLNTK